MHHSEVEQRLAIEKHCYFLKCFVRHIIIKNNTVLVPQPPYGMGTTGYQGTIIIRTRYLLVPVPLLPAAAAACGSMLVPVP